jgi:hypothetical protein
MLIPKSMMRYYTAADNRIQIADLSERILVLQGRNLKLNNISALYRIKIQKAELISGCCSQ